MKRFFVFTRILLASLSFVIVNSSNAASITSLSAYSYDDPRSGATVSASLTADEGIDYIDWYVKCI